MKTLLQRFAEDRQGRRYKQLMDVPAFIAAMNYLDKPGVIELLAHSQTAYRQPALAGVIVAFEALPEIDGFFRSHSPQQTLQLRQAIGVAIRILMVEQRWKPTGRKGSLGTRPKLVADSTVPGVRINTSGLSKWFTRSEHYDPPTEKMESIPQKYPEPDLTLDHDGPADFRRYKAIEDEWAEELSQHLKRPVEQIRTKGLGVGDFPLDHHLQIRLADDSFANFEFAFWLTRPAKFEIAVFTEHCGHYVFPSRYTRIARVIPVSNS